MINQIDPKYVRSRLLGRGIFGILLTAIYVCALAFHSVEVSRGNAPLYSLLLWAIPLAVLLICYYVYALLFPALEYRSWTYSALEDRIELKYGVIFKRTCVLPVLRIQHMSIEAGPIERLFGLCDLTIETAGASERIPGLNADRAKLLLEDLKAKSESKIRYGEAKDGGNS